MMPGPESPADGRSANTCHIKVYGIILNAIPYTYPAIVGFLVILILPRHFFLTTSWLGGLRDVVGVKSG